MKHNTDPFYLGVPEKCYVVIQGTTVGVGLTTRGYQGYGLVYDYTSSIPSIGYAACIECARVCVDRYNEALGISKAQEVACEIGSMAGWHVPGANPAHWTDEDATRLHRGQRSTLS